MEAKEKNFKNFNNQKLGKKDRCSTLLLPSTFAGLDGTKQRIHKQGSCPNYAALSSAALGVGELNGKFK